MKIIAVSNECFDQALIRVGELPKPRLNMSCRAVFIEKMDVLLVVSEQVQFQRIPGEFESLSKLAQKFVES